MRRGIIALLICLALAAIVSIVYLQKYTSSPTPPSHTSPSKQTKKHGPSQAFDHIVIILEENKSQAAIIGNPSAPYINQLANKYSVATNYSAITHPSLPNYIALTSGTTAGIVNDCNPPNSGCQANVANIADRLEQAGKSWKAYAESMPASCYANNSGSYAVKHNPFMYYPNIRNNSDRCKSHIVPFSQFSADLNSPAGLPNYSFITPNMCNDMHDCSVQTGDAWLARLVPQILASKTFTKQHSLLVITWDEGSRTDNTIPTIFAGPAAKLHGSSSASYSHYSLLRTVEANWKLRPLTQEDAHTSAMSDLLR